MRQCISLHIDHAGVQMGNACWELFRLEHEIQSDGLLSSNARINDHKDDSFKIFFNEISTNKYTPTAIMIDLQPTVIDEIRTGFYRDLFPSDQLISGKEDARNSYARGYYTIGADIIDLVLDRIQKLVDQCDLVIAFFLFHSLEGGTGSGFTSLLMEHLTNEYGRRDQIQFSIYPSSQFSTSVVEPYNASLSTHATLEHSNSQVVSTATISSRFHSRFSVHLQNYDFLFRDFYRIHFPLISYAPIINTLDSSNLLADKTNEENLSLAKLTDSVFEPANQMIKCNPTNGEFN